MANIPDPITRTEQYYSYMAGESSYLPDPITRRKNIYIIFASLDPVAERAAPAARPITTT